MTIEIRPELEALIRERMKTGEFQSVEDVLLQAMKTLPPADRRPRQNLADFLLNSPFAGSGLDLERHQDYGRPVDL